MTAIPPPPGFVLDAQPAPQSPKPSAPPPPAGFVIDGAPVPEKPEEESRGILGTIGNVAAGIGERAADLIGGGVRALGEVQEPIQDALVSGAQRAQARMDAEGRGIPERFKARRPTVLDMTPEQIAAPSPIVEGTRAAAKSISDVDLGYEEMTSWEDFKESPVKNFIPFALEQGLISAPDMAAAVVALPAYVAARTGELGQERAQNNGVEDATVEDLIKVLPASVGSALLERFGARGMFGLDEAAVQSLKQVPKAAGKAALKEGVTEAGQESLEYGSTTIGTEAGFDPAQMAERAAAGAVGGTGFGGIARGVTATGEVMTGAEPQAQVDVPIEGREPGEEERTQPNPADPIFKGYVDAEGNPVPPTTPGEAVEPGVSPTPTAPATQGGVDAGSPPSQTPPAISAEQRAILRRAGTPDDIIDMMPPEQAAAEVEAEIANGIRVNKRMIDDAAQYRNPNTPVPQQPSAPAPQQPSMNQAADDFVADGATPAPNLPQSLPDGQTPADVVQGMRERFNAPEAQSQRAMNRAENIAGQVRVPVDELPENSGNVARRMLDNYRAQQGQRNNLSGTRQQPAKVDAGEDLDLAGLVVNPEPTEAQKAAGNYQKYHAKINGFDVSIENPKGSIRSGTSLGGQSWQTKMPAHYGYIKRTQGADGDQLDVYVGPKPESQRVYVVDQRKGPGSAQFDEHKAIMGAGSVSEAREIYAQGFSDGTGAQRIGAITPMSVSEFRKWLKEGDTSKPVRMGKPIPTNDQGFPIDAKGKIKKPESLIEFLARKGGIQDQNGDLDAIGLTNRRAGFVTGAGPLVRKTGMTLDAAREMALEAGYLTDPGAGNIMPSDSTITDLLDALDADSRNGRQGFSQYDQDHAFAWQQEQGTEAEADAQSEYDTILEQVTEATGLNSDDAFAQEVARAMVETGMSVDDAVDRVAISTYEDAGTDFEAAIGEIPFFEDAPNEVQPGTASETRPAVGEASQLGEESRAQGEAQGSRATGPDRSEGSPQDGRQDDDGRGNQPGASEDQAEVDTADEFDQAFDTALDEEFAQPSEPEPAVRPAPEPRKVGSWVLRNKETGEVIAETSDRKKVDALNTEKYEAVPIQDYLASLNKPKPADVTTEPGADNKPQTVIPGAERITRKQQAERQAERPMRASKPQREAGGMFDEGNTAPQLFDEPAPAKDVAKSAAKNTLIGLDEVASGLTTLFGGKNKFSSGLSFDEDTYKQAVPYFKSGVAHFKDAGKDIAELVKRLVRHLAQNGMDREAIQNMRPYVRRFVEDVQSGTIDLEGDGNAPTASSSVERDSGSSAAGDGMGATNVSAQSGQDGQGAQPRGGRVDQSGTDPLDSSSLFDGDAAAMGTQGNRQVREAEPDDGSGAPNPDERSGSGDIGGARPEPDRIRADAVEQSATDRAPLEKRREAQKKAEAVSVVAADRSNIDATLPMLLEGQREDVLKAEERFRSTPGLPGIMFTNGTGTGKTFTGLGIAKRFAKQGKDNILILAPSQGILSDWQKSARDLLLDISILDSTKDAGKGVVATTYANFAENEALVKRKWDLIIPDEAHKLSQNANGDPSIALQNLRAVSNQQRGWWRRAEMILSKEGAELKTLREAADGKQEGPAYDRFQKALTKYNEKRDDLIQGFSYEPMSNVVFLSATPFAYDKNVDYAEGWLFRYPAEKQGGGYNTASGRDAFFVEKFGYRMRYNKLTRPEADVRSEVMERQFHEGLKNEGALSGRKLEVDADYDRSFILVDDAIGNKIDEALKFLDEHQNGRLAPLAQYYRKQFDYLARMRLLEAMKAQHVIPLIKKSHAMGRKVVVFHDYNRGGGVTPFPAVMDSGTVRAKKIDGEGYDVVSLKKLEREFHNGFPGVKNLDFSSLESPIDALTKAFPNALVYNGSISKKMREEAKAAFNEDGSDANLIIVQSAAGEAGISLHDTTGKHQRVLFNLGMPTRPTTALQQEGRIYRTGQVSNALLRYMNTGTTWERMTFAGTIAQRSGTAENLAMGEEARAIKQSFIDAFEDSAPYEPSENEGIGGKAKDRERSAPLSAFERAKTFYFANQKKTSRNKAAEGVDYFATPEPVGLKMVEWANIRPGERVLEPSAGHGAIARFFPEDTSRTVVEPSTELMSRAALASPGAKAIGGRFEDFNIVNKFEAVVMNPPFGMGGKTAIEHIQKAMSHLAPGGRVVAVYPTGPSADKRLDALLEGDAFGGFEMVADIAMPTAMFGRAGTQVATRIIVIDRSSQGGSTIKRDIRSAENVNEMFDRIEEMTVPPRAEPAGDMISEAATAEDPAPQDDGAGLGAMTTAEFSHTRTGDTVYVAKFADKVDKEAFNAARRLAKEFDGHYSSFRGAGAIPGFHFESAADRDGFAAKAQAVELEYSANPAPSGWGEADGGPVQTRLSNAEKQELADIVKNVSGIQDVDFWETIPVAQGSKGQRDWGGTSSGTASGFWSAMTDSIVLALDSATRGTAYHEAFHRIQDLYLNAQEKSLLARENSRLRQIVATDYANSGARKASQADKMSPKEIEAEAFRIYSEQMEANNGSGLRLHVGLRRAWERIRQTLRRVRNALNGMGYQTSEDVFKRSLRGDMAERGRVQQDRSSDVQFQTAPATNTAAFKRWFGNSKVVDENGDPLVVYHGTEADFDTFNTNPGELMDQWFGIGSYFATDKNDLANHLGVMGNLDDFPDYRVVEAHLSIKNPYVWDATTDAGRAKLKRDFADAGITQDRVDTLYDGNSKKFTEWAKAQGHDGVFAMGQGSTIPSEIVAFSPSQIKSVNNRGTFDPNDDRIMYSLNEERVQPGTDPKDAPSIVMGGILKDSLKKMNTAAAKKGKNWFDDQAVLDDGESLGALMTRKFEDYLDPLLRMQTSIQQAFEDGKVPASMNPYKIFRTANATAGPRITAVHETYVQPALEELANAKAKYEDLLDLLKAEHTEERNRVVGARNPEDSDMFKAITDPSKTGASGWSLNKANETIARLQKDREKYRALRRAAGMIRSMLRENLRQQLRSGLISQDTYDLLTNQWQNYIPLKGMDGMDEQGGWMPRGKGFDVRGDEFKQAKGRSTDAQDVVAHAISQTTMSITRQENNKGNKALLKLIANVDPQGEKIAQVYWLGDKDGAEFDGLDGLTKAKDVYRRTIVNGKVVMRKASNPFTVNNIGDVVAGKIGGKTFYIKFADPKVGLAIRKVNNVSINAVARLLRPFSTLQSIINTRFNPEFFVPNLARDAQTAGMHMMEEGFSAKQIAKSYASLFTKIYPAIWRHVRGKPGNGEWDQVMKEFVASGGKMNFETRALGFDEQALALQKKFARMAGNNGKADQSRQAVEEILKFISDIMDVGENGMRLAIYKAARDRGEVPLDAVMRGREVTVDFEKHGEWGPNINAMYVFFNAALQGNMNIVRRLARSKKLQAASAGIMLGGVLQHLWNMAASGDDDDGESYYEKLLREEPYRFERQMLFFKPGGKEYYTIPLPYGYNAFWHAGVQGAAATSGKVDPLAAGIDSFRVAVDAMNPLGSGSIATTIAPTIIDPILELSANKNFFGGPIYPEGNPFDQSPSPDSQNSFKNTSDAAKGVAAGINSLFGGNEIEPGWWDWHPETYQYIWGFFTGGIGRFADRSLDTAIKASEGEFDPEKTPFVRSVYGEFDENNQRREYFNQRAKVQEASGVLKDYQEKGDQAELKDFIKRKAVEIQAIEAYKAAEKQRRKINKARRAIEGNKNMPDAAKKKELERLDEIELEVMKQARAAVAKARRDQSTR